MWHVWGTGEVHTVLWWGELKERDRLEELGVNYFSRPEAPSEPGLPQYRDLTITLRHTTLSRTPLDE